MTSNLTSSTRLKSTDLNPDRLSTGKKDFADIYALLRAKLSCLTKAMVMNFWRKSLERAYS